MLVVLVRVVDGEGFSEKQSGIGTNLKVRSLVKPSREKNQTMLRKYLNTNLVRNPKINLHAYIQSFPENGLVEVVEHLVRLIAALPCVEIAHNLQVNMKRINTHCRNSDQLKPHKS